MNMMFLNPTLMIYLFVAIFAIAIIASIIAMILAKKKEKYARGDILRKILKERAKSIRMNRVPGVKIVAFAGGKEEIKRKPGNIVGRYLGSIEWEYMTEMLVRKATKKYYFLIPNEYLTDPNRKVYVIRARGITYHTFAFTVVTDSKEEQERVFNKMDQFLDFLMKTLMRLENKEAEVRASIEASEETMTRVPWWMLNREEEVKGDED